MGAATISIQGLEQKLQEARDSEFPDSDSICDVAREAYAAGHSEWGHKVLAGLVAGTRAKTAEEQEDTVRAHDCIAIAKALAKVGETQEARTLFLEEAQTTISFVYCIDLAEHAFASLADEALARSLYECAVQNLTAYGLASPITNDVEEEDHYHAEIANSVIGVLGDEELGRRILLAGVDAVDWDGGDIWHFLFVSLGIGRDFTLDLIELIASRFEDELAEWNCWEYLATGAMHFTDSKRTAGKLVTRGRRCILRERPDEREKLKEEEAKVREKLGSMDTLSKQLRKGRN